MILPSVVFVHGLEGRPDGTKPTALRRAGFVVVAPDGRGLPLADRIRGAALALEAHPGSILVGSSYGWLAAAYLAATVSTPIRALVLLAPALHHAEPPVDDPAALRLPATLPARVLHGTRDLVVPLAASRRFAADHPHLVLTELDDAHDLRASLDAIVATVRSL